MSFDVPCSAFVLHTNASTHTGKYFMKIIGIESNFKDALKIKNFFPTFECHALSYFSNLATLGLHSEEGVTKQGVREERSSLAFKPIVFQALKTPTCFLPLQTGL